MRAAVVEQPGVLKIKEVETPKINSRQILIKIQVASICNATDNHILHGIFEGYHDFYPQILGHELSGEVVDIGSEVANFKLGDIIVMYSPNGAFCEYVAIDSDWPLLAKVPESTPLRVRSLSEMFHGAYVQAIYPAQIKSNETVLIVGLGPMGLTAAVTAKLTAGKVIGVDLNEIRVQKALELGIDAAFNRSEMTSDEIVEAVKKANDGKEADVVVMCISEDRSAELDAFDMAVNALKRRGRMTGLVVDVKDIGKNHRVDPHQLIKKEATFAHTLNQRGGAGQDEHKIFQDAVNMVAEGKINFDSFITHEVDLDGLPEVLDLCINKMNEVIKVVVYPN